MTSPDPQTPRYDTLITQLWELREEKRQLAAREKEINEEYKSIEHDLIAALNDRDTGITSVKGSKARATLTSTTVIKLTNPETFYDFATTNNMPHLIRQQPASAACKEALQVLGLEIPGIELISLPSISLHTNR